MLVLDIITIALLIVLVPIFLVVLFILCFFPMLDRIFHYGREYTDGTSTAYIINLPIAVIHGIMQTEDRVDPDLVFSNFEQTYLNAVGKEFVRWKQRAVKRCWLWPYWTSQGVVFEPSHHFRRVSEPLDQKSLELKLAEIALEIMDFDRPLWELWVFENYTDDSGKACSMVMLRLHHCMADGFTGLRQIMHGANPNKPPPSAVAAPRAERRRKLGLCMAIHYWLRSFRKLVFMADDRPSVFKARSHLKLTDTRRTAWHNLKGTSVDELKKVGKHLDDATINDILVSALAGSLKEFARRTPNAHLPADITLCSWVSLSPLNHIYSSFKEVPFRWGNGSLGAVYLKMPILSRQESSTADLMSEVRKTTNDPSLMMEAGLATKLCAFIGWLPPLLSKMVWPAVTNKTTVSMSNVPGPQFPFKWVGVPVRSMLFFVPPTGTISIFVTIATMNGEVNVGVAVDSSLMSQEQVKSICGDLFEEQIENLKRSVAAMQPPREKV